jgi:hypothetical protein
MGRYDGEDYEVRPACRPDAHDFAMNGNCWKCRRNRDTLIRDAQRILELFPPFVSPSGNARR